MTVIIIGYKVNLMLNVGFSFLKIFLGKKSQNVMTDIAA